MTFQEYVKENTNCINTTNTYLNAYNKFKKSVEGLHEDYLRDYIKANLKNKNEITKLKNAIKLFCMYKNVSFQSYSDVFKEENKLKPKSRRKNENLKLDTALRSINGGRNKKLKLSYRLMLCGALRVHEVANLKKKNIEICDNGRIYLHLEVAKGGKKRSVKVIKDKWLEKELKDYIVDFNDDEKLFYSEHTLKNKKYTKGKFKTHQLRSVVIQNYYYKCDENKDIVIKNIQLFLGHEPDPKNTTWKRYLYKNINKNGTKFDN